MQLLSFSGLLLVAICVNICQAKPTDANHEKFSLNIQEKGSEFQQEVDLDEKEGIVTVHVPQHNDVDETYFITDTKKHLTMRVAPLQKMCFLTEHDPEELPSADVWRQTRDSVQTEFIKDAESKKKMMSYVVTESLDSKGRDELARKMKTACDGLPVVKMEPIYKALLEPENLELFPKMTPFLNYTRVDDTQHGRFKRQITATSYIDKCSPYRTKQKCVVFLNSCYFVVDCSNAKDPNGREAADCATKDHIFSNVRCCIPCCEDKVSVENPSAYCQDNRLTKEMICPNYDFAEPEAADDPSVSNSKPNKQSKLQGNNGHEE